jgi:hypothetical protein
VSLLFLFVLALPAPLYSSGRVLAARPLHTALIRETGDARAFHRLEISFSQGRKWKMLMSRYIAAIPVNGDASCAVEQSRSLGLPTTSVSNAIIAKVGAAARCKKLDAPRIAEPRQPAKIFVVLVGR